MYKCGKSFHTQVKAMALSEKKKKKKKSIDIKCIVRLDHVK